MTQIHKNRHACTPAGKSFFHRQQHAPPHVQKRLVGRTLPYLHAPTYARPHMPPRLRDHRYFWVESSEEETLADKELSSAQAEGDVSCSTSGAVELLSVCEALTVLESAGEVASSELKVLGLVLVGLGRHVPARADGDGILKSLLLLSGSQRVADRR